MHLLISLQRALGVLIVVLIREFQQTIEDGGLVERREVDWSISQNLWHRTNIRNEDWLTILHGFEWRIAKALKEQGFPIARRTVAKYRDALKIPVARLRR